MEKTVFDDIRVNIEDSEFVRANYNRGKAIPALSETMLEDEYELERVSRLRNLFDKMVLSSRERDDTLVDMKISVDSREKEDEQVSVKWTQLIFQLLEYYYLLHYKLGYR